MTTKNIINDCITPNFRNKDVWDGECSCATCRRIIDKTCPVTKEIQASDKICNYYKIITPRFEEEQNATR